MSYPGPREVDPSIRDRLVRSLLIPVHETCVEAGFRPSAGRVKRVINTAITEFLSGMGSDSPREKHDTTGWYYEGNGNGQIEKTAVKLVLKEMRKKGVTMDPRNSSNQAIVDAADDEGYDSYADEPGPSPGRS